jgi:transcriptional regulator with XRE-family HTH domain
MRCSGDACPASAGSPTNGDLGRAIRQLRREHGLTIEELGFAAGVHPTYLSGIERGVRNPTWGKLCSLADTLGTPVVEIARRAESTARVRIGLEHVLEQEQAAHHSRVTLHQHARTPLVLPLPRCATVRSHATS